MSVVNEKKKKFDRQLRLWGSEGQLLLEKSSISLINITLINSEILKNLVIGGVNNFLLIDKNNISSYDIYNNFMISYINTFDDITKTKKNVNICHLMQEMNPEFNGKQITDMNIHDMITNNELNKLLSYDIIISSQISDKSLNVLSLYLWDYKIPLIHSECFGLIGYIKVCFDELFVTQTHPENEIFDLRIQKPFPELETYLDSIDINEIFKSKKYPTIVILSKLWEKFKTKKSHNFIDGVIDLKIKDDFRQFISHYFEILEKPPNDIVNKGDTTTLDKQTINELLKETLRCVNTSFYNFIKLPPNVEHIFNHPQCNLVSINKADVFLPQDLNVKLIERLKTHAKFWLMALALKTYWEKFGSLPLAGTLPDMDCDTDLYIKLVDIYHNRFLKDYHEYEDILLPLVSKYANNGGVELNVSPKEMEIFCKNSRFLKLIKSHPVTYEPPKLFDVITRRDSLEIEHDGLCDLVTCYFCLRAYNHHEEFWDSHSNDHPEGHDTASPRLKQITQSQMNEALAVYFDYCVKTFNLHLSLSDCEKFLNNKSTQAVINECVRSINCDELATTAAFIGGIASQECIKILTNQYIPLNGLFIYNGITGKTAQF